MPTTFELIAPRGVVIIRHFGHLTVSESQTALAAYLAHPDCHPGQHHLVDCSDLVSYERDFASILQVHADMADTFSPIAPETLLVIYAPSRVAHELGTIIRNSWSGTGSVVARLVPDETEALDILGQPERRIADLRAQA